ncbi:MAG: biopolymer transporter ExbD [Acidobacteriota bacterium]|nr:biopolymer transporter ExbD [Acidobacteriota bacterium]
MKIEKMKDAAPQINITPLIDILLVLLIIFMVISPLKPTRFETKLPAEPDERGQTNPRALIVSIDEKLQLRLNNSETLGSAEDTSKLNALLAQTFEERVRNGVIKQNAKGGTETEKTVFIKAPRTVNYGAIAKVVDGVKGAGANPIGLQIDDLAQ